MHKKTLKQKSTIEPKRKPVALHRLVMHPIPIYYAKLWIGVIASDQFEAVGMAAHTEYLGDTIEEYHFRDADSLLCFRGSKFMLLFRKETVAIEKLAHEVFHLTHRVMELCSCNFDAGHHEQGAYLHGWLMELVFNETRQYLHNVRS